MYVKLQSVKAVVVWYGRVGFGEVGFGKVWPLRYGSVGYGPAW